MKLYTEEQIIEFLETKIIFDSDDLKELTPIELPSGEDVIIPFPSLDNIKRYRDGKEIKTWMEGWEGGYKRARVDVLDKIQGGNK